MDPEIKAMSDVVAALTSLDPEAVRRVLKWAFQRYNVPTRIDHRVGATDGTEIPEGEGTASFSSYHELFDATNPSSAPDKALVTGYWFQVSQGQEDLDSQQLNKELKNLGHSSTNITRDLDALIRRMPRQVMQVRKEGHTKQARKRYKLTREGIRAVEKMLGGAS